MDGYDWQELEAQIETHGPEKVEFYVSGVLDIEKLVRVIDIKFEDDAIKVVLE